MSTAAAPSPSRNLTRGYSAIPNSLIENQALLTDAELRLSLVVLRRGDGLVVSDRTWQQWTGLSPRAKEYAAAGLKNKQCLSVEGRGDRAKYGFARTAWEVFVRSAPAERPRTHGRKAVDPKPGAKIHPECRERGCALLAQQAGASEGLSLVPATGVTQPVAQTGTAGECLGKPGSAVQSSVQIVKSPSVPTRIAQPVAQRDPVEDVFSKTLAAVRAVFPMVGVAFLVRLLAAVRVVFAGVTDDELAQAVDRAWLMGKKRQDSEGLFLLTVPEALADLRRVPAPVASLGADTGPPGIREGVRTLVSRVTAAVRARGGPVLAVVPDLDALARLDDWDIWDHDALGKLDVLDTRIAGLAELSADESARVDALVSEYVEGVAPMLRGRHDAQGLGYAVRLESAKKQKRTAAVLEVIGVPRLGGLSA